MEKLLSLLLMWSLVFAMTGLGSGYTVRWWATPERAAQWAPAAIGSGWGCVALAILIASLLKWFPNASQAR